MKIFVFLTLLQLLLSGCNYTVIDWSSLRRPLKPIPIYNDSSEVPFAFKEIGGIRKSLPYWVQFDQVRELTRTEKEDLLFWLVNDARHFNADALIRVKLYAEKNIAAHTRSRNPLVSYSPCGTATMIQRVEE